MAFDVIQLYCFMISLELEGTMKSTHQDLYRFEHLGTRCCSLRRSRERRLPSLQVDNDSFFQRFIPELFRVWIKWADNGKDRSIQRKILKRYLFLT